MTRTYQITTPDGKTTYVVASSRQAACMKYTGMREAAAIAAKQIVAIKICKE